MAHLRVRYLMLAQTMVAKAQGQAAGGEESVTKKEELSQRRKDSPIIVCYKELELGNEKNK